MQEICICDYCNNEFQAERVRKDPLKNLCLQCKINILGKKCLYCDDPIDKQGEEEPQSYYCGYCETVKLGKPDTRWLPSIKGDDIDRKGFHKI